MSDCPGSTVDQAFAARLAACTPEDFDGHTEFAHLAPEQRIEWLEQVAWSLHECRQGVAPLVRQEES